MQAITLPDPTPIADAPEDRSLLVQIADDYEVVRRSGEWLYTTDGQIPLSSISWFWLLPEIISVSPADQLK